MDLQSANHISFAVREALDDSSEKSKGKDLDSILDEASGSEQHDQVGVLPSNGVRRPSRATTRITSDSSVCTAASNTARARRIKKTNENILELNRNLERQRARVGNALEVAGTLTVLANQYAKRGNCSKALEYYTEILQIRAALQGEDHMDVATTLHDMGKCKASKFVKDYEGAVEHFEGAIMIREMNAIVSNGMRLALADLLCDTGHALFTQYSIQKEDEDNAEEELFLSSLGNYEKALEIQQDMDSLKAAITLSSMGDVYFNVGRDEDALKAYQDALTIQIGKQGKTHVNVAETHHKIALVQQKMGSDKASESFSEALRVKRDRLGGKHVSVATTLACVGKLSLENNDLDNALVQFEDALDIWLVKVKEVHEEFAILVEVTNDNMSEAVVASWDDLSVALGSVAELHFSIGRIHEQRDDLTGAHLSFSKSLQMRLLQKNGEVDEEVIIVKEKVAIMLLKLNDSAEAIDAFLDLLELKTNQAIDKNSIEVANVLLNLARAHQANGEQDDAMKYFDNAVEMKASLLGDTHDDVKAIKSEMQASLFIILVASGNKYKAEGDDFQAIRTFKEALSMRADLPGDLSNEHLITLLDNLSDLYCNEVVNEMFDEALVLNKESLTLKENLYGKDSIEYAKAYLKIASVQTLKGDYDDALETYQIVLENIKLNQGRDHAIFAEAMHCIGCVLTSKGDYGRAMRALAEAVRIREILFTSKHPCYLDSIEAIGKVHHSMKKEETALEAYDDCLQQRLLLLDEKRTEFAEIMQLNDDEKYNEASANLLVYIGAVANVHHLIGLAKKDLFDIEGAFESFNNELKTLKLQLCEGDLKLAAANEMIAVLHTEQGNSDKAMELFEATLKVKQLKLGRHHVEYANTLINMGHVHRSKGYTDEALRVYQEGARIKETKSGTDRAGLFDTYNVIGDIYSDNGDKQKAADAYVMALEYLVEQSEEEDSIALPLLEKLGDAYVEIEATALALKTYQDALDRFPKVDNDGEIPASLFEKMADAYDAEKDYMAKMKTYVNLGRLYMDIEDLDNASIYFVKALKVEQAKIGELHMEVAQSLFEIGQILQSQGQLDLALKAFNESVKIQKQLQSTDKMEISLTLEKVGDIYKEREELSKARSSFEDALEIRGQVQSSKDNVDMALLREKLASVYLIVNEVDKAMNEYLEVLRVKKLKSGNKRFLQSVSETIFTLGTIYRKKGQSDEAMESFKEALKYKLEVNGADHISLEPIRTAIGDECMIIPDYVQARVHFSESLRILESHGKIDQNSAIVYFKLGKAEVQVKDYACAVSSFTKCLDLRSEIVDENEYNDDILITLEALGDAKASAGDTSGALNSLEKLLAFQKQELTKSAGEFKERNNCRTLHKSLLNFEASVTNLSDSLGIVASTHYRIGTLHRKLATAESYSFALENFNESRNMHKLQRGEYHADVAVVVEAIGITLIEMGEYDDAMNSFLDALRINTVADKSKVDWAQTINYIGKIHYLKGEFDEALLNLQEALKLRLAKENSKKMCLVKNYADIADVYIAQMNYAEALKFLESAITLFDEIPDRDNAGERKLLIKIGAVHQSLNELDSALEVFEKALQIEEAYDSKREKAELLETLASCYFEKKSYDISLKHYQSAYELRKELSDEDNSSIGDVMVCIGKCYYKKRNAKEALRFYTEALEIRKTIMKEAFSTLKRIDRDDEEYSLRADMLKVYLTKASESEHSIGVLHRDLKQYETALDHFKGEMGFRKLAVGDSHADVANVMESIATTKYKMGDTAAAKEMFIKTLQMKKDCLGEDSTEYATSLNNLGNLFFADKDYDEALKTCTRALEIKVENLGRDDIAVAQIHNNVGSIHYTMGAYDLAASSYEETARINRIKLGTSAGTAMALSKLADAYLKNNDLGLALHSYSDAYDMFKVVRGEESLEVANSLEGLANVYFEKNDLKESMSNYLTAYEMKEKLLDEEHPAIAKLLENMGKVHVEKGETDQALGVFQEVLRLKKLRLGDDSVELAETWENLAVVFEKVLLYDRAIRMYELSYEIKVEKMGECEEVARLEEAMADVYQESGNLEDASTFYYRSLAKKRNILGKDDVELAEITGKIAKLHKRKGEDDAAEKMFQIKKQLEELNE